MLSKEIRVVTYGLMGSGFNQVGCRFIIMFFAPNPQNWGLQPGDI
jgi:hypothetical protein